jgi:hypothetical protein
MYVWKDPPEAYYQQVHYKVDPGAHVDILDMACFDPRESEYVCMHVMCVFVYACMCVCERVSMCLRSS